MIQERIMEYKLYIGYTTSNGQIAQEICEVLEDMRFHVCAELIDDEQVLSEKTKTAMEQSDKILLIVEPKSKILTQAISCVSKLKDGRSIFLYLDTKALPLSLKFLVGNMNTIDSSDVIWQNLIYCVFGDEISVLLSDAKELHVVEKKGLFGFADEYERILIPCQWIGCGMFSEGLAPVQLAEGKWGYIDTQGHLAIPYKLKNARPFMKGYGKAVVQNNMGKWVYMDKDGTLDDSEDDGAFGILSPEGMEANYAISMEIDEDLKNAGIVF